MKRILTISALAVLALSLSGCDFFRMVAGRPTSADIAAKRSQIEAVGKAHQQRLDSLSLVQKQAADSLALLDSIKRSCGNILRPLQVSAVSASALKSRYYVMVGTFSLRDNAERQTQRAIDAGYEAVLIPLRNGFCAVGVAPADNLAAAFRSMQTIKGEAFCPKDVWILVNE